MAVGINGDVEKIYQKFGVCLNILLKTHKVGLILGEHLLLSSTIMTPVLVRF